MRSFLSFAAVILSLTLLSACSGMQTHTEIEALNEAKPTGSPFTQRLAAEYKSYVKDRQRALDYSDARHFARKGLLAAQGKVVMPEPLSNWHLSSNAAKDLGDARIRLVQVLDAGGRAQAPFEAATAQARFDCWIEQQEQLLAVIRAPACRAEFESALNELKGRMQKALPKSDKMGQPVPAKAKPPKGAAPKAVDAGLDEGMFLVFFDFNKKTLNDTGRQIVDAVAAQAKKRHDLKSITLIGHADTVGSDKYNQRLSSARADAVKAALVERGIDAAMMMSSGRGEKEPMVPTKNNTREPANRRVEVSFQ